MLKQKFVPTPLIRPEEREPIVIDKNSSGIRFRGWFLIRQLLTLGSRLLRLKLAGTLDQAALGAVLRNFFQEMGVLWIKVGQLLSLRIDLLSPTICDELSKLQDQAHGFSPAIARRMLEEGLGSPIAEVFDPFIETPFAAASISQVHRAYLTSEQVWVAVKIRKPDAQEIFSKDMAVIRRVVRWIERFSIKPHMRWQDMVWEIEQLMTEELDYRYEATNMRRMRKILRPHQVYAPKVFFRYSTSGILVMEFVHGVLMTEYLTMFHNDPDRLQAWIKQNKIDPDRVGRRLLASNMRQMFEANLFHGDLHPGNIVLLRNNRIAFIDFGSIGFSDPDFLGKYMIYLEAVTQQEFGKVFDLFLLFPDNVPAIDMARLKEGFMRTLQSWYEKARVKTLAYDERSINEVNQELTNLLGEYRITMPWTFLRAMRAMTTMDATLRALIPQRNVERLTAKFLRQRQARAFRQLKRTRRKLNPLNIAPALVEAPIKFHETMFFRGAIIRRLAQVFEGVMTQAARGIAALFKTVTFSLRLSCCFLVFVFAEQQQRMSWMMALIPERLAGMIHNVPYLEIQIVAILFCVLLYTDRLVTKLRRRFQESEPKRTGF